MPCNRHGGGAARGEKKLRGRVEEVCVCVLTFCRHSEKKTGSSFQTPVQAKEWVSSVKESDTELSQVFFKYSIVGKSLSPPPPPTTFSPISCYLLASWLEAGWPKAAWEGGGRRRRQTCLDPCFHRGAANPPDHGQIQKTGCFDKSPPSPRKAASQKKALQNQKLIIKTFK